MSPELIDPQRFGFENSRPTKSSDCYALGMVIYETISGNLPFHKHTDLTVFVKVLAGERPLRGAGFAEGLWKMLELCWTPQPNNRPEVEDVLQCLEVISNFPKPHSPGKDEEMEEDGYDLDSASGSSDVPSRISGTMAITSPGLSYLTDHPLSSVSAASVLSISEALSQAGWIDPNDGFTYNVRAIWFEGP